MISDRVCPPCPLGRRSSNGSAIPLAVPPEVRLGGLLEQDTQEDVLLGLTVQLRPTARKQDDAATDPFLGIPRRGNSRKGGLHG
jgi:hypothetical protein